MTNENLNGAYVSVEIISLPSWQSINWRGRRGGGRRLSQYFNLKFFFAALLILVREFILKLLNVIGQTKQL